MTSKLISDSLTITIVDDASAAPDYKGTDFKLLKMEKAVIVRKGTAEGNPTVDIQLKDEAGGNYLIMATGGIIEMLSAAIEGAKQGKG